MSDNVSQNNEQKGGKKGGKGKIIVIVGLVAVIAVMGVIIYKLLTKDEAEALKGDPARDTLVNEENAEEIAKEMLAGSKPPENYEATMNSTWYFTDGSKESRNAYVENSTSNENDIYFDLEISDTGEVIYESPVIPVGNHLDKIKLNKELAKGTYDCVLTYHMLDADQNTLGTVKMVVTVVVEN